VLKPLLYDSSYSVSVVVLGDGTLAVSKSYRRVELSACQARQVGSPAAAAAAAPDGAMASPPLACWVPARPPWARARDSIGSPPSAVRGPRADTRTHVPAPCPPPPQLDMECRIHSSISHPNIVQFWVAADEAGQRHVLMEYCRAGDLRRRMAELQVWTAGGRRGPARPPCPP